MVFKKKKKDFCQVLICDLTIFKGTRTPLKHGKNTVMLSLSSVISLFGTLQIHKTPISNNLLPSVTVPLLIVPIS